MQLVWGALTFSYTHPDWNTETLRWEGNDFVPTEVGANVITVTNLGNMPVVTSFTFTPGTGFEAVTTAFTVGETNANGMEHAATGEPVAITAQPAGLLPFNQSGQLTLGSITISLTEGGNA